ncbi:SulP family inorganic anion transporter [Hymenobacter busanensis]|uniref:SulP family inorganic anion transporter n=1 Tax=Hymenobacter busanensis TaxID=2607656 RepID=UPI0013674332|nr:SulP family inorganic anion transporter [Hymenobacter busanensis]QHJ07628.1 carbonic anhydrase [Hymenobacter busanensis]
MPKPNGIMKETTDARRRWDFTYWKNDLQGGFVSFLVAVPLCLGIALASGAPLFAGIIAGIVGGLVVGALSRSAVSISGPEAGLILVVLSASAALGSFAAVQLAICVAGLVQIGLGFARAGFISQFIPSAVIKGMMAAIGLILVMKQVPHVLGYDADVAETLTLFPREGASIVELVRVALGHISPVALGIAGLGVALLMLWERPVVKTHPVLSKIPGALLVVLLGVGLNQLAGVWQPEAALRGTHLVQLPVVTSWENFLGLFTLPDFAQLRNPKLYTAALSIALVASLEALLAVEATDELDPLKRKSPTNRELKAQGVGNLVSGMLGGLPLTSVVVRSSVSINAGGRTRLAALLHGTFLLLSVLLFPTLLNLVPWAALAAVLLVTGYKLTRISIFRELYQAGSSEFLPFVVTVAAILATDLLVGIGIGAAVGVFFVLRENYRNAHRHERFVVQGQERIRVNLGKHVSFISKASILKVLESAPDHSTVEIDGTLSAFIDRDVVSAIENFRDTARRRGIQLLFLRQGAEVAQNLAGQRDTHGTDTDFDAYYKLFGHERNWVAEKLRRDPSYFEQLRLEPAPKFLFIGCSDSRVPASQVTGAAPDEVFVHRNVANLVVSTDLNLLSVLQYAVEVLGVEHVVVCGHYGCGGVRVAMHEPDNSALNSWLGNVRTVMQRHQQQLAALETDEARHRRLVELNVIEQVYNLHQTAVLRQAAHRGKPVQVHGWVYDTEAAHLRDLDVDVRRAFEEYDTELRYQVQAEGLVRLPGHLHQPPSLYSVYTGAGSSIIAVPPFEGDAPQGTP